MRTTTQKRLLTFLLIILFSGNTFTQHSRKDILRLQISKETNDTNKIKLLIQLGLYYSKTDTEQDSCLNEAYVLSKKKNYQYGLAYGQYHEGLLLSRYGKHDEAIAKCKRSIDVLDSLGIIQAINDPLSTIRFMFNSAGRDVDKFRYYTEKVVLYKRHGPIENTANCFHGIAGYYNALADYDKAIGYYLRAMNVYKSFDSLGYANEMQAVGSVYMEWGNLDKAEVYLKSALKELIRLNMINNFFFCYHKIGDLYFLKHDYNQALQYYFKGKEYETVPEYQAINLVDCAEVYLQLESRDKARFSLDSAEKIRKNEKLGISFSLGNLEIDYTFYKYYVATGEKKRALQRLETALLEAQSSRYLPLVLKYTNELHSFLLKKGDSLQALRYLIQYHDIQDSLNILSTRVRIATFEIEQQAQLKENEIEQLQSQQSLLWKYYLIGGAFLVIIVTGMISRFKYKRKRDEEQLKTEFKKQLAQAETKALRAQMNPHFIFNCLNSINSFVIEQKHEIASDYLIKFSKLIRLILDNSRCEKISIEKELEALKLYVLLESSRFDNKFKFVYHISDDINIDTIMIPPMLLQPFVENAIWHGLMQKETAGTITLEIKKEKDEFLNISIMDDGIGREKASELKSKSATHKSQGLKVTSERIELMNKPNSTGAHVNIIDLIDENNHATGTKVELIIPF